MPQFELRQQLFRLFSRFDGRGCALEGVHGWMGVLVVVEESSVIRSRPLARIALRFVTFPDDAAAPHCALVLSQESSKGK